MGASLMHSGSTGDKDVLEQHQYLTFMLGGEVYAIGILHIKEIIEHGQVTAMPMMPDFIRGVINLRGRAVPVVDLSARFNHEVTAWGKRTCIVILEIEAHGAVRDMGVIVDAVNEVLEIPREEIEPPPALGTTVQTNFIAGMGKIGGEFVIILDVDRILSLDELALVGHMSTGAVYGAGAAAA